MRGAQRRAALAVARSLVAVATSVATSVAMSVVACVVTSLGAALARPLGAQAPARVPGFVILVGRDTLAVERVDARDLGAESATLDVDLFLRGARQRVGWTLAIDPEARARRLVVYQYAPGAGDSARPVAAVQFAFGADTVVVTGGGQGTSGTTRRIAAPDGTLPWIPPSAALLDRMTRRARRLGVGRADGPTTPVELPVLNAADGRRFAVRASALAADSVLLDFGDAQLRLAADGAGALRGGVAPGQRMRIVAVPALDAGAGRSVVSYDAPPGAPYVAESVLIPLPGGVTLAGTLTRPRGAGAFPVVVTLPGAGPHDRDGAPPLLGDWRPFRALADTLARRGIAVLRVDDRGVGASEGRPVGATLHDRAEDARAIVAWLRARAGTARDVDARRVALVGHAEGALVAAMVAADDSPEAPTIAAVALLAGAAEPGRALLARNAAALLARDPSLAPARRDSLLASAVRSVDSASALDPWLRVYAAHDPAATARRVRAPVLVLHGETDGSVPVAQADALAAAVRAGGNGRVTVRRFAATNHLLVADPSGDPAGYDALPDARVRPAVLGALADWLVATLRAAAAGRVPPA